MGFYLFGVALKNVFWPDVKGYYSVALEFSLNVGDGMLMTKSDIFTCNRCGVYLHRHDSSGKEIGELI